MQMVRLTLAALALSSFLSVTAFAGTFTDVSTSHDNRGAIEYLAYTGTLEGYSDNTFRAEATINRAELMKVLVAGQGIDPDADTYNNCFPDVTTDWYARYVCYAYEEEWVDGYPDNTFLPGNTVNKVEAAKMIINAMGYADAVPTSGEIYSADLYSDTYVSAWYAGYVQLVKYWNLDGAGDHFYPADGMTRGEVAEYMFRIIAMEELGSETYADGDGELFLEFEGLSTLLEDEDVLYENTDYGFSLTLPGDWTGYVTADRELNWGDYGTAPSIDFAMEEGGSIFNISFYAPDQWATLSAVDQPLPTYLGETDTYVIAGSASQEAPEGYEAHREQVTEIFDSFMLLEE